jgi:hypothetical protein
MAGKNVLAGAHSVGLFPVVGLGLLVPPARRINRARNVVSRSEAKAVAALVAPAAAAHAAAADGAASARQPPHSTQAAAVAEGVDRADIFCFFLFPINQVSIRDQKRPIRSIKHTRPFRKKM